MIYRVGSRDGDLEHFGYSYYTNKREAERAWREGFKLEDRDGDGILVHNTAGSGDSRDPWDSGYDSIETLPLPRNKAEILAMLEQWASHSDNGP